MAYQSGGLLRFANPDLTTRLGAQSAMDLAKFCFLIVAGFRFAIYAFLGLLGGSSLIGIPAEGTALIAVVLLIDVGLPLLAAWRLHVYQGAFVVPVVTALYVLGILASLSIPVIVIGAVCTGLFVGGIRGAWALRRDAPFEDDHYATFG